MRQSVGGGRRSDAGTSVAAAALTMEPLTAAAGGQANAGHALACPVAYGACPSEAVSGELSARSPHGARTGRV